MIPVIRIPTVASAIISAVKDGADVINLSLGGETGSEVLKASVSYANNHGIPVIAAVGNGGLVMLIFLLHMKVLSESPRLGLMGELQTFLILGKE